MYLYRAMYVYRLSVGWSSGRCLIMSIRPRIFGLYPAAALERLRIETWTHCGPLNPQCGRNTFSHPVTSTRPSPHALNLMSRLFHHLRVHQVFGANTDVGKTLLTAALVRASSIAGKSVYYIKPVSTGPPARCRRRVGCVLCWICLHLTIPDRYVIRYAGPQKSRIESRCLFRYSDPVSPHLAALRECGEENAPVNIFG